MLIARANATLSSSRRVLGTGKSKGKGKGKIVGKSTSNFSWAADYWGCPGCIGKHNDIRTSLFNNFGVNGNEKMIKNIINCKNIEKISLI